MSRFNTGNPLGSNDPRDLDDNAKNMDLAVNSEDSQWIDRFGRPRLPLMEQERQFVAAQERHEDEFQLAQESRSDRFNDFIASSGYQFLGDYGPGIEITEYNQLIRDSNGEFWRVSGQVDLPYVTTGAGIPEDDALVPAGDAVLRQDLSDPDKGAALVARGVVSVDSIADLLALPAGQRREGLRYLVKGYYAGSDVGGGEFYWDESDEASPNFGTVLSVPGVATGRFRREYVILTDRHFGVYDGMDAVEARDRIQALVNVGHPETYIEFTGKMAGSVTIASSGFNIGFSGDIEQDAETTKTFNIAGAKRVTLIEPSLVGKGTEFNGASTSYNGVAGIFISNGEDIVVERPRLRNHAGGGIRWTNVDGLTVVDPVIVGVGSPTIQPEDNGGDFGIGSWSSTVNKRIKIISPDVSGHAFGLGWGESGSDCEVTDYYIHDIPGQHAMYFAGAAPRIGDGTIERCALAGIKEQLNAGTGHLDETFSIGDLTVNDCLQGVIVTTAGGADWYHRSVRIRSVTSNGCADDLTFIQCDDVVVGSLDSRDSTSRNLYAVDSHVTIKESGANGAHQATVHGVRSTCIFGTLRAHNVALNPDGRIAPEANAGVFMTGGGRFEVDDLAITYSTSEPASLDHAFFAATGVKTRFGKVHNGTTKPLRYDPSTCEALGALSGPGGFYAGEQLNPIAPVSGDRRKVYFSSVKPTFTGLKADFCYNTNVSVSSGRVLFGWVCISGTNWQEVYLPTA